MSSSGGLTASPLKPDFGFNWVFFVELFVCGVITIFFLFYFNRVFANLVSHCLRAWTWHKYRVYIHIQALQFSLLGGRIFFKGLKFHGNNETILVHSGYVTWAYWLRNIRKLDVRDDHDTEGKSASESPQNGASIRHGQTIDGAEKAGVEHRNLPCRINVSLNGVEWFAYNSSTAYDALIARMEPGHDNDDTGLAAEAQNEEHLGFGRAESGLDKSRYSHPRDQSLDLEDEKSNISEITPLDAPSDDIESRKSSSLPPRRDDGNSQQTAEAGGLFILRFLPIHIECSKAAIVLGNENTKSVLILKADRTSGEVSATKSTPLDQYKQLINFQFEHPVIQMKPNEDYNEDQMTAASRVKRGLANLGEQKRRPVHNHSFLHRQRHKAWHSLQNAIPFFRSSVESFSSSLRGPHEPISRYGADLANWQGLSRYLDENEQEDKARWSSVEYAIVSTIFDSPKASMSFYWDIAGAVQNTRLSSKTHSGKETNNINGDQPPEWGIDLLVHGGFINYGPWADRQRADIQSTFFPVLCKDNRPSCQLTQGQYRVPTQFKLNLEFDRETTLRMPIREDSKNWKWSKQGDPLAARQNDQKRNGNRGRKRKADKGLPGPEIRPFGWLDIKVAEYASVKYVMDMIAGPSGFYNRLELDLPKADITTSVNHGLLWRSAENRISCDLSNPLKWNGQRTWKFDIVTNGLELFILREHIFLLTDLTDDWASGPLPEYLTFTPFQYLVNLRLETFKMYLNVNDANIVNRPSDFDDNTFIVIFGSTLNADISVPMTTYRPPHSNVAFTLEAKHGGLNLHVPPWNTQASFLDSAEIAQLKRLAVQGEYQYCASTSPKNTDTLLLNVHGHGPSVQFYGFIIRYFMKIKDNYFGDDIRFKTLEEYQEGLRQESHQVPPYNKSNDLDVIMSITADEANAMLPSNLYSAKTHVRVDIAELAADLRVTNYYMDLDAMLNTLAFSQGSASDAAATPVSATSSTQLFIDGVNVCGNRLFGLPPTEPTYVCNWDFDVGAIKGECTVEYLSLLANSGRAFAFSFGDDENALPLAAQQALHDVTFLRAHIESTHIWIHVEEAAFLMSTGNISLDFNDWACSLNSKKLNLLIPDLCLACVDAESASRHRTRAQQAVETHAVVRSTLSLSMIQKKHDFEQDRQWQQEHIQCHDQRTHRANFLLDHRLLERVATDAVDPPAMPVPMMPFPAFRARAQQGSKASSSRSVRLFNGRKSSFLTNESPVGSTSSTIPPQHVAGQAEAASLPTRSRRLQNGSGMGRQTLRDLSASTDRQSSFYSAVGEPRGIPPSTMTLSSSYVAPYFPLEGICPDSKDLPSLYSDRHDEHSTEFQQDDLIDVPLDRGDKQSDHVSFIITFSTGISAVLNPKAINAVADLVSALQAIDPMDILDTLQIDSMESVFRTNKQKQNKGKIMDLSIRTPDIRLRFLNSSMSGFLPEADIYDQYEVSISRLVLTVKDVLGAGTGVEATPGHSYTLHLSLASAGLSAKERSSATDDPQAAVDVLLKDLVFWAVSDKDVSASIILERLETNTASGKLEYLASLLHRTNMMVNDVKKAFIALNSQYRARIQLFTYLVVTAGHETADPLFLTRPSYVLRSASDHLRLSESWKVVTRLRHMYTSLPFSARQDIVIRCPTIPEAIPRDAKERVFAAFNQWRSWDLENLSSCLALSQIYGSAMTIPSEISQSTQLLNIAFRTGLIRLVIDPGPKQNEVSFAGISAAVETQGHVSHSRQELEQRHVLSQNTVMHFFCKDVSVNLNWELCELAEDIQRLYHHTGSGIESLEKDTRVSSDSDSPGIKHSLHLVIATGNSSITIDTINARAIIISKGMNASVVLFDNGPSSRINANVVIAAKAITSRLSSHSQEFALYQLRSPSLYTSYEVQGTDDSLINDYRIAANCRELSFLMRRDVPAVIEVLDLIIGDEVAQLYQLRERLQDTAFLPKQRPPSRHTSRSTHRFNVALFLDIYQISIPLLHSLAYNVSGSIARASISAEVGSEIIFNFDVKEHFHDIQTVLDNHAKSISLLHMPPTNGRIIIHNPDHEITVSVYASVEPIKVDAAALHGLLTALNRPEISNVIVEIKEDIKSIDTHIKEVFGTAKITSHPPKRPLIYDIHLALAGLDIFANTQGTLGDHSPIRLDLDFGTLQLLMVNRAQQHGTALAFPELRMSLNHIMFELSRFEDGHMETCGNLSFAAFLTAASKHTGTGDEVRSFNLKSDKLSIYLLPETASSVADIMGHLQDKIKDLDLSREKKYLRKLRKPKARKSVNEEHGDPIGSAPSPTIIFASMYSLELLDIHITWFVGIDKSIRPQEEKENLVLSLKRLDLSTRKENSARLSIEDLQVQMVPASHDRSRRSPNSALLPEIIFNVGYVSTPNARRLAFQAAGKSLNLRLTSQFIIPASKLQKSIQSAVGQLRAASAAWSPKAAPDKVPQPHRQPFFGKKRMESLLVDADFAGAVVYLSGKKTPTSDPSGYRGGRQPQAGKYGQFTQVDTSSDTVLRAPGLAWKIEYKDNGLDDPSLNAEVKVDASSNILYPTVVPLILEVSSTIKDVVSDEEGGSKPMQARQSPQKFISSDEDNILTADPSAVLGRTRLNMGIRICKQEFSLSCQPIARVAATARFDDIYMTVNTVRSIERGHFFAASATFSRLQASVQHVYSRESTGSFEVESIFLSLMNSKHVSGTSGVSAILKISPMKVLLNVKQLQDFLLFREIWGPLEVHQRTPAPPPAAATLQSHTFLVQRYQQVASTGAFPWNATVSIAELDVQLDLGQAIGKSAFMISNFWISSKKNSDWEQNLCSGFEKVGVDSTGRMSGFVALQDFKVRTSIKWPAREKALNQTPLVQASIGFSQLRVKAAFDYQAFLVADITSFEFVMYNVRNGPHARGDRLVAILDGEAVQVFCTTTTASQGLALYQALLRLVQEKRANYETSLKEIEKFMKRKSLSHPTSPPAKSAVNESESKEVAISPISLHTDVIATMKAVNIGAFPSTFSDHQVFKLEALNAQARFAIMMESERIHSILSLTLGQLRIGLAGVKEVGVPKSAGDISVEDVVSSATGSRGGTILKVPRVAATMQTWQTPNSTHIDYIFKSSFEGKVEVGWNYSRISYIRSMWATHSKVLAQRLGKPLPPSALKITGVLNKEDAQKNDGEQHKITAEVNVPQSKYNYTALEPPIIETPQLRDMGEATPPLEWIGLHRDKLPNLTHQIAIVTLEELAEKVEEAYGKILGSS